MKMNLRASLDNPRHIFLGSLVFMLLFTWFSGYNVGFHQDEMDMNNYGKANYKFYASGGKENEYLSTKTNTATSDDGYAVDTMLRYYGPVFDYVAVGINKVTGLDKGTHEFNSRHALNQFIAIIGILFAGLIAFKISGWRAAIFTQWLLFLTPVYFGNGLFNTKDIPFCVGYTASLYFMVLFFEGLPKPSWKATIRLLVSLVFAIGTRIGGVLLFLYLILFIPLFYQFKGEGQKKIGPLIIRIAVLVVVSMLIVVIIWPYLLLNPVDHIIATLQVVNKFPGRIKLAFEGNVITSTHIPYYYLVKYMAITIPVFILAAFVMSLVFLSAKFRTINWQIALLILFASLFPIIYAMIRGVALYSQWRHFLFIYPGLVIISGVGLSEIMKLFKRPWLRYGFVVICIGAMLHPIIWSIKNHPYEYCYFNELEGGFKEAYYNYETDYWEITAKKAADWFFKNEPIEDASDSVVVATNLPAFLSYYTSRNYPNTRVKFVQTGVRGRSMKMWDYCFFNTIFLDPEYLQNGFPPVGTIHSENIDEIPETIIIKDTERIDFMAVTAFQHNDFRSADSLFNVYQKKVGDNPGLYGMMCFCKALMGRSDEAVKLGNMSFNILKTDVYAFTGMALVYANRGRFADAIELLQQARTIAPKNMIIQQIYQKVSAAQKTNSSGK